MDKTSIFLIFPNQLYYNLKHLASEYKINIYLIEEPRFFTDYNFHKLKLAYHRATMKKYYYYLKKKINCNLKYIEFNDVTNIFYKNIYNKFNKIYIINVADHKLENKLSLIFKNKLQILENINFLIKVTELEDIKKIIYKNGKYYHDIFYKYQRKKLDILMDKDNKPIGNKWSFDNQNRLSLPKNYSDHNMTLDHIYKNKYVKEAIIYINKHFPDNYGSLDNFIYPIDLKDSKKWLFHFLEKKLANFGKYQDAVSISEPFIYHSVISPMMNIGLLIDTDVVNISYDYYLKHKTQISIESFEGFIRQIIGWRNYVYTIYMLDGEKIYEMNHLEHYNKINHKFWTATTNILPIDNIIKNIIKYSYAHHIERLMFLGNFLLLCFIDPKEVHKIFMEWTIDAYDWLSKNIYYYRIYNYYIKINLYSNYI